MTTSHVRPLSWRSVRPTFPGTFKFDFPDISWFKGVNTQRIYDEGPLDNRSLRLRVRACNVQPRDELAWERSCEQLVQAFHAGRLEFVRQRPTGEKDRRDHLDAVWGWNIEIM